MSMSGYDVPAKRTDVSAFPFWNASFSLIIHSRQVTVLEKLIRSFSFVQQFSLVPCQRHQRHKEGSSYIIQLNVQLLELVYSHLHRSMLVRSFSALAPVGLNRFLGPCFTSRVRLNIHLKWGKEMSTLL
jgi:hypothetical protein